jgi:hypothetical protein
MKKSKRNRNQISEQKILDSMIKQNPSIKTLIDSFDLQISKPKTKSMLNKDDRITKTSKTILA